MLLAQWENNIVQVSASFEGGLLSGLIWPSFFYHSISLPILGLARSYGESGTAKMATAGATALSFTDLTDLTGDTCMLL